MAPHATRCTTSTDSAAAGFSTTDTSPAFGVSHVPGPLPFPTPKPALMAEPASAAALLVRRPGEVQEDGHVMPLVGETISTADELGLDTLVPPVLLSPPPPPPPPLPCSFTIAPTIHPHALAHPYAQAYHHAYAYAQVQARVQAEAQAAAQAKVYHAHANAYIQLAPRPPFIPAGPNFRGVVGGGPGTVGGPDASGALMRAGRSHAIPVDVSLPQPQPPALHIAPLADGLPYAQNHKILDTCPPPLPNAHTDPLANPVAHADADPDAASEHPAMDIDHAAAASTTSAAAADPTATAFAAPVISDHRRAVRQATRELQRINNSLEEFLRSSARVGEAEGGDGECDEVGAGGVDAAEGATTGTVLGIAEDGGDVEAEADACGESSDEDGDEPGRLVVEAWAIEPAAKPAVLEAGRTKETFAAGARELRVTICRGGAVVMRLPAAAAPKSARRQTRRTRKWCGLDESLWRSLGGRSCCATAVAVAVDVAESVGAGVLQIARRCGLR